MQGQLDQARQQLDDALARSVEAHSTRGVTLCLIAFARVTLAEGDPETAELLAGATQGLRGRAGFRAWPMLRQGEAEMVAQVHQRLGSSQFDPGFSVGSGFTQREVVAIVRGQNHTGTQTP
jgi:hypothetical protein